MNHGSFAFSKNTIFPPGFSFAFTSSRKLGKSGTMTNTLFVKTTSNELSLKADRLPFPQKNRTLSVVFHIFASFCAIDKDFLFRSRAC